MIIETRIMMGMPITLKAAGSDPNTRDVFDETFRYFERIDQKYSPFIASSDVSRINAGTLTEPDYDLELQEIIAHAEKTKHETNGYFNIWHKGVFDPSGIVKGWAIRKAADQMSKRIDNFYVDAGGDIQAQGTNDEHLPWRIGIRNPFDRSQNVAIVSLTDYSIATSGTAIRGQHIYDPLSDHPITEIVSLSVIAPNILDADRMATAAFAMGKRGINFIEKLPGYEAYMIDDNKRATQTSDWHSFEAKTT